LQPDTLPDTVTGRCYCGACSISAGQVLTAAYCHCIDCRRWTGAAVAGFAVVAAQTITLPEKATLLETNTGVQRWTCMDCGSPLAAAFDYLPEQVYLPLGIVDQATDIPPRLHAHADAMLPWLNISDALPREGRSARDSLNASH